MTPQEELETLESLFIPGDAYETLYNVAKRIKELKDNLKPKDEQTSKENTLFWERPE